MTATLAPSRPTAPATAGAQARDAARLIQTLRRHPTRRTGTERPVVAMRGAGRRLTTI